MLVLIGIIILAISFIIALVSLVREEKHRESLAEETDVEEPAVAAPEEIEPELSHKAATDVGLLTKKEPLPPLVPTADVFPWEEGKLKEVQKDDEEAPLPLSEARYPHLGESNTLVGEVKISDLSKKKQ